MKSMDATGMGGEKCHEQSAHIIASLTGFLQLEQNSKLHVGQRTERGSSIIAFDDEGCCTGDWADDDGLSIGPTEQIVSQFLFGHHRRFLSSSTSVNGMKAISEKVCLNM